MSLKTPPSFGVKGTIKYAAAPAIDIFDWTVNNGHAADGSRLGAFTVDKVFGFPGDVDEKDYPKLGGHVFEAGVEFLDEDDPNLDWTGKIELLGRSATKDGIRCDFKLDGELEPRRG